MIARPATGSPHGWPRAAGAVVGPCGGDALRGSGGVVTAKVYGHIWQKARAAALTKTQQSSPLAARPYDLRHGGITLALNAGVPAPEVASRAGHGVEVLWRVYAGCIDGQDQLWNHRIEEALTTEPDDTL